MVPVVRWLPRGRSGLEAAARGLDRGTHARSAGADEKLILVPPREFSLEQALAYIEEDELLEVTPKSMRLRKRNLDHNTRKRDAKAAVAT